MYFLTSMLSHSCTPNAAHAPAGGSLPLQLMLMSLSLAQEPHDNTAAVGGCSVTDIITPVDGGVVGEWWLSTSNVDADTCPARSEPPQLQQPLQASEEEDDDDHDEDEFVLRAVSDIAPGEEIYISYLAVADLKTRSWKWRQEALLVRTKSNSWVYFGPNLFYFGLNVADFAAGEQEVCVQVHAVRRGAGGRRGAKGASGKRD